MNDDDSRARTIRRAVVWCVGAMLLAAGWTVAAKRAADQKALAAARAARMAADSEAASTSSRSGQGPAVVTGGGSGTGLPPSAAKPKTEYVFIDDPIEAYRKRIPKVEIRYEDNKRITKTTTYTPVGK